MLHMKAEGGRTKRRLDKFRRGGRRPTNTTTVGPPAAACIDSKPQRSRRRGLYGEQGAKVHSRPDTRRVMGGTKPAYKRGGRSGRRHYDDGGLVDDVAPSTGGSSVGSNFGNGHVQFR